MRRHLYSLHPADVNPELGHVKPPTGATPARSTAYERSHLQSQFVISPLLCYSGGMAEEPQNEPVLKRFCAAVGEVYGDRIERVVLYGSRARGDHKPDSDYNIAVFIKDPGSFYDESGRLAAITTDILTDTGAVISATPFPAGAYRERTGFMHELRKDGLDL